MMWFPTRSITNQAAQLQKHGVQSRIVLVDNFFHFFEINFFCFVFAVSDLVHDVEAIHGLC